MGVKLVRSEGATPASLSQSDWKRFATFAALNAGPVFVPNRSCWGPTTRLNKALGTSDVGTEHADPSDEFMLPAGICFPWPTLGFPAPIGPKSCAMPSQDGIGLNNLSQTEQAWPEPRHPHQQDPVTPPQPETSWCSPQGDVELMPQKEVLNFKPAPRLEQIGDIHSKQMDDRNHHFG